MKDGQFQIIAQKAGDNFREQILKLEDEAKEAMLQILEDTQESGRKAILSIGASVKIAFTGNPVTMTTEASINVKHKVETSDEIEDPDQGQLPFTRGEAETKVTIATSGMDPVETTAGGLRKAADKLRRRSKE